MKLLYCVLLALMVTACEKIDFSKYIDQTGKTTGNNKKDNVDDKEENNKQVHVDVHMAILADTISQYQMNVMLVSLNEWSGMTSSYSESTAAKAQDITARYCEDALTGWRIPTRDDAIRIRNWYDGHGYRLDSLNEQLEKIGATPILCKSPSGITHRYLCANGDSTFSMQSHTAILKAGATVKYNLRLVKDTLVAITPSDIEFNY